MIAEPDAWDECAACGHDRDDHGASGCQATEPCPCEGFEAAA